MLGKSIEQFTCISRFIVLLILFQVAAIQGTAKAEDMAGFARVIHGDTIFIGDLEVRLYGIDALETNQYCQRDREHWPCGQAATEYLWKLIGDGEVTCGNVVDNGQGQMVGRCFADGVDIGAAMVDAGLALAYRRYSRDYIPHEMRAREKRAGIFSGSYTPPWVWRMR